MSVDRLKTIPLLPNSDFIINSTLETEEIFPENDSQFILFGRARVIGASGRSWSFPAHFHNNIEIFCSNDSIGTSRINGKVYDFNKGDCIYIPSGAIHDYNLKGPIKNDDIFLAIKQNKVFPSSGDLFNTPAAKEPRVIRSSFLADRISELYQLEIQQVDGRNYFHKMVLFYEILDLIINDETVKRDKSAAPGRRKVREVMAFLNENWNKNDSIEFIASSCAISPWYMCRLFRIYTDKTIIQYRNVIRVEKAQKLLANGEDVTETAFLCGYKSLSYFIKTFKMYHGISPGKVKNN